MDIHRHTKLIFIGNKLLMSPLEALFSLLIFIFCKDLNATPLQITLLVSSKPLVALLSFYGNVFIKDRPQHLKSLIIWSTIIGSIPCLFFPFIESTWFYIGAFALFMMSARAMIPAWSEILKINLDQSSRGKVFSQGSITNYLVSILIPLTIAPAIDIYPQVWKWLFFALASLQGLNVFLLLYMHVKTNQVGQKFGQSYKFDSFHSLVLDPWKNCLSLIKGHADFRNYQIVFMFGGAGLMMMHPILPIFFKQTLQLSYTELTLATSLCKGVAFACTSAIWAQCLNKVSIHLFNTFVTLFAAVFALFVVASETQIIWLYFAYIVYGLMQAGSELSWNLAGPIFSKERDSTLYTGVNVAMVGMRGAVAPFIGELIFFYFVQPAYVFIFGGLLCFAGTLYSLWTWRQETELKTTPELV